jgi:hypothetical protein
MGANAQTSVPTFTAGEVLTAANMNISARTGIPVFADSTARDAAFGGTGEKTLAEGQFAYLESTNATQYYDGSAWQALETSYTYTSFTPTLTNATLGNGTITGAYIQIGKFVHVKFIFTLGSTSTMGTQPQISLPVTGITTNQSGLAPIGWHFAGDTSVQNYFGYIFLNTTTTASFWSAASNLAVLVLDQISATQPFTWGNTDVLSGYFSYQAA